MKRPNRRITDEMYLDDGVQLYLGDAPEILRSRINRPFQAVVTSPPYAEQRKAQYGSVPEDEYDEMMVKLSAMARALGCHLPAVANHENLVGAVS